jgi:hypothetical protein
LFNRALIPVLRDRRFQWTEDHWRIYDLRRDGIVPAPVVTWATRTFLHRIGSTRLAPALLRRWSDEPIVRIAVHPLDFDDPLFVNTIKRTIGFAMRTRVLDQYEEVLTRIAK